MSLGKLVRIGAAIGQSYNDPQSFRSYESNFLFRLPKDALLYAKLGSWGHAQDMELHVSGINGIFPLDYFRQGAEIVLSVPFDNITVIAQGHHSVISSVSDFVRSSETRFDPSGTLNGYSAYGMFTPRQDWKILLSVTGESDDGKGRFYSNSQSYGAIRRFDFESLSFQAAVHHSFSSDAIMEADLTWHTLSGELEGYGEDWPFTSIFTSLFPVRENVQAAGSLRLWQFHIGGIVPVARQFQCGFGASCVRILPRIVLHSWESKYLVFGVRGYQERDPAIRLADAGILSGGFHWKAASFVVTYSITQIIPFNIERLEQPGNSEDGGGSSSSGAAVSTHSSGGQFHQASIAYEF